MEYTQPLQPRETPQIDRNRAMRDGTLKDHGTPGTPGHRRRSSLSGRGKRASTSFENNGVISESVFGRVPDSPLHLWSLTPRKVNLTRRWTIRASTSTSMQTSRIRIGHDSCSSGVHLVWPISPQYHTLQSDPGRTHHRRHCRNCPKRLCRRRRSFRRTSSDSSRRGRSTRTSILRRVPLRGTQSEKMNRT